MKRAEMIAQVKARINKVKTGIDELARDGRIDVSDCTWNDFIENDTGVYIANEDAVGKLSNADLKRVIDTYE